MASSELADGPASGSGGTGLFDLLRSFSEQARLALGTRGVVLASVAGIVGLACCLIAFADIGLSLHRSDVDPQRHKAREVLALDNASRLLMRDLLARSGANRPVGAEPRMSGEPWADFAQSLGTVCRDFAIPPQTMLASTCATRAAFTARIGGTIAAIDAQTRTLDPGTLRELLSLRDDISELSLITTRAADSMIGQLVDDYATALLVLTLSTTGFACAGLMLILLVGRASMDYHAQWRRAVAAAGEAGASRDLLREVIDALPAGVAVYDADERLVMSNAVADSLTPIMEEQDCTGWTYEALALDTAQRLEAAGRGPQRPDDWVVRFRRKDPVPSRRQAADGRWFDWSEKVTSSGLTVGLRINVTDIKGHEMELERTRARYQTLVDSLSDMVYAVDVRGRYTYVSPGAADLLGVPPESVNGTRFKDWIVPEDVERVIAGGRECHFSPSLEQRRTNFRMRAPDGSVRPVELRFRKAGGGDPDAAQVGVIRDVTELERARAEYQVLVDSLADVAYRLDVETGQFVFVSAAARNFFGMAPEKMVGTHFLDYIAPDSVEQVSGTTTRAYSPDDPGTFARFNMIAAGGHIRNVEVRASRRIDEQGRLISTGLIRDVEERVQLEARLESEMTRLRSVVGSGGALIVVVGRDLDVTMVNSGFTALTGIAEADAVGRPLHSMIDVPLNPERTKRTRLGIKLRDPAGRERLIAITATPVMDGTGQVSSIVLMGVDDTERREAEQALYDAERFATVGEMAGTMAHEISQPLQVINISCALAREELADAVAKGSAGEAAAFVDGKLERIASQVDAASRIIGDLRAYVRGTASEAPGAFDPNEAVRRAIDMTDHGVREAGMHFAEELASSLPAVMGDVGRLEQVLVNLVNNARDAGGRMIALTTGTVERNDHTFVRIAVEDSGPGITAEILPQLFHSFVTTKPRGKGTGLGLRICRRILEEMGGSITAGNRPEGGACFEILLPAAGA
jgi:PAS domain S-box-containing protein